MHSVTKLFVCGALLVFAITARADCEDEYQVCTQETCKLGMTSAINAIGGIAAATQGNAAAFGQFQRQQEQALRCVDRCKSQLNSCQVEERQLQAQQEMLEKQQEAMRRQQAFQQQQQQQQQPRQPSTAASKQSTPTAATSQGIGTGARTVDATRAQQWLATGYDHYQARRYQDAWDNLEAGLELLPENGEGHYWAMKTAEALKQAAKARVHAVRFLQLVAIDPRRAAVMRQYPTLAQEMAQREQALVAEANRKHSEQQALERKRSQRPVMPLQIPEEVWAVLERLSERAPLPLYPRINKRGRVMEKESDGTITNTEFVSSQTTLGSGLLRSDWDIKIEMGDSNYDSTSQVWFSPYIRGALVTVRRDKEGTSHQSRLVGLQVEGALFPLQVGARSQMRLRYEDQEKDTNGQVLVKHRNIDRNCAVIGDRPAAGLVPDLQQPLPGNAWEVSCVTRLDQKEPTQQVDYLLDAFGTTLSNMVYCSGSDTKARCYAPLAADRIRPISEDNTIKLLQDYAVTINGNQLR